MPHDHHRNGDATASGGRSTAVRASVVGERGQAVVVSPRRTMSGAWSQGPDRETIPTAAREARQRCERAERRTWPRSRACSGAGVAGIAFRRMLFRHRVDNPILAGIVEASGGPDGTRSADWPLFRALVKLMAIGDGDIGHIPPHALSDLHRLSPIACFRGSPRRGGR